MRRFIAISAAKIAAKLSQLLKQGSGSSLPGRVALALYPSLLEDFMEDITPGTRPELGVMPGLAQSGTAKRWFKFFHVFASQIPFLRGNPMFCSPDCARPGMTPSSGRVPGATPDLVQSGTAKRIPAGEFTRLKICTSGTNGKTTTTGMVKQIFYEYKTFLGDKSSIICNDLGANLYYGIVAAFLSMTDFWGNLRSSDFIIEVDEAAFPKVAKVLQPELIAVTNIYRDQLDRFGEIDTTQKLIRSAIQNAGNPTLVLNANDPKVLELADSSSGRIILYQVDYALQNFDEGFTNTQAAERVEVKAHIIKEEIDRTDLELHLGNNLLKLSVPLPGLYNSYNATAAAAIAYADKVPVDIIKTGIENYKAAFGRSETKIFNDVKYQVFLIKNPTGASEVLKHLSQDEKGRFLIIINDNYADGRDVSWLWDAKFEYLNQVPKSQVFCSGRRAYDMALRLKYAGISDIKVEPDIRAALDQAVHECPGQEHLYVLPTYTALLELEKL
jgi:UDP-N-acetylmuramyl tripeptide synthase